MQEKNEIRALLRLIDDPDDEVFDTVAKNYFIMARRSSLTSRNFGRLLKIFQYKNVSNY